VARLAGFTKFPVTSRSNDYLGVMGVDWLVLLNSELDSVLDLLLDSLLLVDSLIIL
jgi:hypothetical protein